MEARQQAEPMAAVDVPLVIDDLPMSLEAIRTKLDKAKHHLERYQAFLRLANVEIEQRNRYIIALTTFIYQAGSVDRLGIALKLALVQALETTNTTIGAVVVATDALNLTLKVHKGLSPHLINILTGREMEHGAAALMPYLVSGDGVLLEAKTAGDDLERRLLRDCGLTSLVSLPLFSGRRVLGALLVGLQGSRTFKPSELCFLMALSQETTVVLDSLRLRDGLWQTAETLLEHEPEAAELPDTLPEELTLAVNSPLPLPLLPAGMPEPAEDDLEQLLAAMMEAEDEVQQQNTDLQTLNAIATALNRSLELKDVLKCAVEQAGKTLESDAAWLYLLDETGKLRLRAFIGLSEVYRRGMQFLKIGEGLEGRAVAQNRPIMVDSFPEGGRDQKFWVEKEGLRAVAVVPLPALPVESAGDDLPVSHAVGGVTGVLAVGYRQFSPQLSEGSHMWSPREMRLLTSLANLASLAIHNARLHSHLRDREISARTGNEILTDLNKMLLERNNVLVNFIEQDVIVRANGANQLLDELLATNLSVKQKEQLQALGELLSELKKVPVEPPPAGVSPQPDGAVSAVDESTRPPLPPPAPMPMPPVAEQPAPLPKNHASPKAISFAEAVAAGLVPSHILEREQ